MHHLSYLRANNKHVLSAQRFHVHKRSMPTLLCTWSLTTNSDTCLKNTFPATHFSKLQGRAVRTRYRIFTFDCSKEFFSPWSLLLPTRKLSAPNVVHQWAPQCSLCLCVCISLFWPANNFLWHLFVLVSQVNSSSLLSLSVQTWFYTLVCYSSSAIHPQAKFTYCSSSTYPCSSTPLHLYFSTRYFLCLCYTLKRSRTADSSKPVSTPMIHRVAS